MIFLTIFYDAKKQMLSRDSFLIKKDVSVCHERWTKKTFESPTGVEPMTFHTLVGCSNSELQETHGELGHLLGSCYTSPAYC